MKKSTISYISLIILAFVLTFTFHFLMNEQAQKADPKTVNATQVEQQMQDIQEDFLVVSGEAELLSPNHLIELSNIQLDRFVFVLILLFLALILCIILSMKNGLLLWRGAVSKMDKGYELEELTSE